MTVCLSSRSILVIAVSSSLQRVLVDPINRYTRSSIGIDEVKFQLHHLVRKILEVQIKHCFREANQCVDRLAKTGTKLERDFIVYESPPSVIILMLFYDCTGMYFERLRPNFVT